MPHEDEVNEFNIHFAKNAIRRTDDEGVDAAEPRVYWAGEQVGKPEKKRAALAHMDTILGLDKVLVQVAIRTVLVSGGGGPSPRPRHSSASGS